MGPTLFFFLFTALHFYVAVSLGHPLRVPALVRLIPPSIAPEGSLEKLFSTSRQEIQGDVSSSKVLPSCRQGALDREREIGETCLSCTTNVDIGQVSECPEGCCRTFEITEDLETAHFITCYKGCCIRSIGVLSDSSDREAGVLDYEGVFSVNNDVTDGSSKGCGSSCAAFSPRDTSCSDANSFRVPAFGQALLDPPCSEAENNPGSTGPGDDSGISSTGVGAGTGGGTDDSGGNRDDLDGEDDVVGDGDDGGDRNVDSANDDDRDMAGPANDQDKAGNSDTTDATGPIDGGGVTGDDEENLEASAAEEVEESSPAETDDGSGDITQDSEQPIDATGEQSAEDGMETDDPVCFPAAATVQLVNGHRKRMEELRPGDLILVRPGTYSRVFGFTHEDRDYHHGFVELGTTSGQTLRLTHGHYMYSDGMMRKAREVQIGHTVKLGNGSTSEVTEIGEWSGYGLFNPQTADGDIVVDGVVVSTYTEAIDGRMAHALLTPLRAMSEWVDVSTFLNLTATGWIWATKTVGS